MQSKQEAFDQVWEFDVDHNVISIGWSHLGDVSTMNREVLANALALAYPGLPATPQSLFRNMIWKFYHEITPGDFVIARRGRKTLAAVGKVVRPAVYAPGRNPTTDHPNFLEVLWQAEPRDKAFPDLVFPMQSLVEITEVQYRSLLEGSRTAPSFSESTDATDEVAFVLEKHLEEFVVANFSTIFKGRLQIYQDAEVRGQQYVTEIGIIDILAVRPDSGSFVVIELKRGRTSDQVVGQILRYMGWVKKNLCKDGQGVEGQVICSGDPDPKLTYAVEMISNVKVRYYSVSFSFKDTPDS